MSKTTFNEQYMEALLTWIGDNHIQFTDGNWYHEDDKDGDQPISEKELVKQFVFRNPLPTPDVKEAVEFAEWIGEQGLFNGLSPDNIRRWHKMVGNSKPLTTSELYQIFKNQK